MSLPCINSHDSWSRLEEVWLGDVYPPSWYDHLAPEVRDVFYQLTEITKQDLDHIQHTLERMGICVRRPVYQSIHDYLDANDQLVKPSICPRDNNLVVGHQLIRSPIIGGDPWQQVIAQYQKDPRVSITTASDTCINGANVVRVGRDIIIDSDAVRDYTYKNDWPEYQVRVVSNGGHLDGCFAILKPGLILANHYFDEYDSTFPGWQIIMLDHPTYNAAPYTGYQQQYPVYNGKFWDTTVGSNHSFNQHIIDHARDWVGMYTETFFELNCLVIDPHNVVMLAENQVLADTLAKHDICVHWVPFRARSFWDGAVHCLTVDIRRQSSIVNYFPERSR